MFPSPFKFNNSTNTNSTNSISTNSISTNSKQIPTLKPISNNNNNNNSNSSKSIDTTELDMLLAHPKFNDLISNHIQVKFTKEFASLRNIIEMNVNDKNENNQERIKLNELKEQLKSKETFLNNLYNNVNKKIKENVELEKNIKIQIEKLNTLKRKHIDENTPSNNTSNVVKIRKLNSTQRQVFDNDDTETDSDSEMEVKSNNNLNDDINNDTDSDNDLINVDNSNLIFTEVNSLFNEPLTMEGTFDDKHWIVKIDKKYTVIPYLKTVEPLLKIFYKKKFSTHTFSRKKSEFILFEDYIKVWVQLDSGKRYIICLTGKGLLKLSSFVIGATDEEHNKCINFIKKYECTNYFKPININN